jgi:hypothetical protein
MVPEYVGLGGRKCRTLEKAEYLQGSLFVLFTMCFIRLMKYRGMR